MSTVVVPSSRTQQENRLKSRKASKQSGLKPPSRQTENRGTSKSFSTTPLVTPRRVLSDLSNNVPSTSWRKDAKQVHAVVGATSVTTVKVEKHSKVSIEDFPDIEVAPTTMAADYDAPFVPPTYFKELSHAIQHTAYLPPSLQEPSQPPVLSISVPRRPLSTDHQFATLEEDMGATQNELSLLDLPDIPSFDF